MVVVATCTTGGYTLHECDCGESYQDSETEALGHNFVEGGYGDYTWNYCTRCYTYDYGTNSVEEGASTYSVMTASTSGCPNNVELASTSTVEHEYIYASGKLLRETYGDVTLDFFYDNGGHPFAMSYNGTMYYYITNLQGDVVMLVNANGATVATYTYDPWGKVLTATGTMAEINPLRYRGYYYDTESGFYYLQSRYYDPEIGRFINADQFASTGQSFVGYNMYAYCNNNPINQTDTLGTAPCHFHTIKTEIGDGSVRIVRNKSKPESISVYEYSEERTYSTFYEKALTISTSGLSWSITDSSLSLSSFEASVISGGWEFENFDLNLFEIGHVEAGLGYEDGQISIGAMASLWSPSASITIGFIEITLVGHVGSVGRIFEVGRNGFKYHGSKLFGWGIEICPVGKG